jgi:NADPH2:quinone reductase
MTMAIRLYASGGPEVMKWEAIEVGEPGPGQIRIKHHAVGLNFIDVYHRVGLYPLPPFPITIGLEGAGVVEAAGPGVTHLKAGDRVAYASPPMGAYAEARLMPADRVVKLPGSIDFKTAAAMMLQGMTAQYLLKRTYAVKKGQTILVHAAAGGVGLILCQWAKHLGATVIGTVGSKDKAELARAHGCDHVILYREENFVERVAEITKGQKVPVVYDSVGKDTYEGSLDCLAPLGMMVTYGNSSGPIPAVDMLKLSAKGSLFITRPTLMTYIAKNEDLAAIAADLVDVVGSGKVKIEVNQTYALKDAAQAHIDLEARKTTGSTVLIP